MQSLSQMLNVVSLPQIRRPWTYLESPKLTSGGLLLMFFFHAIKFHNLTEVGRLSEEERRGMGNAKFGAWTEACESQNIALSRTLCPLDIYTRSETLQQQINTSQLH
jgi:hypothetical protein